jgi:hypothetical protein
VRQSCHTGWGYRSQQRKDGASFGSCFFFFFFFLG